MIRKWIRKLRLTAKVWTKDSISAEGNTNWPRNLNFDRIVSGKTISVVSDNSRWASTRKFRARGRKN